MKKLGLALGAGGSRGAAHVGFLKALEEAGIKPDYIVGSSMGAIVGGAYALGIPTEDIYKAVSKIKLRKLFAPTLKRGGFCSSRRMRKLLKKYFGVHTFSDTKIPFCAVATDMYAQETVLLCEGTLVDRIAASANMPIVFRPEIVGKRRLADGGILERVPAKQVKEMGADVVVAVDVLGWNKSPERLTGAVGTVLHYINMTDNYRTAALRKEREEYIDFWLEPKMENVSQYAFRGFREAYESGYALGKEYAQDIRKALGE